MSSKVNCPFCNMRLNLAPEMFGQPLKCPGCRNTFTPEPRANTPSPTTPSQPVPDAAPQPPYEPPAYQPGSQPPMNLGPQPPGRNPLPLVLGCLGGGCLLIVIIAALIALLVPRL